MPDEIEVKEPQHSEEILVKQSLKSNDRYGQPAFTNPNELTVLSSADFKNGLGITNVKTESQQTTQLSSKGG